MIDYQNFIIGDTDKFILPLNFNKNVCIIIFFIVESA